MKFVSKTDRDSALFPEAQKYKSVTHQRGSLGHFIATNVGKGFRSVHAFTIMWGNSAAKENRKASARMKKKREWQRMTASDE